jgi:hypothetical protein
MIPARHAVGAVTLMSTLAITSSARAQCNDNADCRAGHVCQQGQCVEARCSQDVDCPDQGTCASGQCRPATPVAPRAAPAPAPPPELYRSERRLVPELYVSGPVLLGSIWLTTLAVTAGVAPQANAGKATAYAAIPVFGPWVMLGSSVNNSPYTPALVVSGIGQAAGLAVTIAGLTVRREVIVPVVGTASGVRFTLVPSIGGAAAVGTF